MKSETPELINNLKELVKRLSLTVDAINDDEATDEDLVCLRDNLIAVQDACLNYDKKAARDAMAELKQKEWSSQTKARLSKISEHLLFSDFEKVSGIADEILKSAGVGGL